MVLPGLATGLGGLALIALRRPTTRTLDLMTGLTAGIMLAAAIFSLLVPSLERKINATCTTSRLSSSRLTSARNRYGRKPGRIVTITLDDSSPGVGPTLAGNKRWYSRRGSCRYRGTRHVLSGRSQIPRSLLDAGVRKSRGEG